MFIDLYSHAPGIGEAAEAMLDAWRAEHESYYGTPHGLASVGPDYAGYATLPGGARWLTSPCGAGDGAYHAVQMDGPCTRFTFEGRRAAMRPEFRALLRAADDADAGPTNTRVLRYATQEPAWAPWETAASRVPEAVRAALRAEFGTVYPRAWDADASRVRFQRPDPIGDVPPEWAAVAFLDDGTAVVTGQPVAGPAR